MKKTLFMERTEMAKLMNFGKYPVLSLDYDNIKDGYGRGCRVRVAWDHSDKRYAGMSSDCTLVYVNGEYSLNQGGACLKSSYDVSDFIDNIDRANSPLVHKGETVVLAVYSKSMNLSYCLLLKVEERLDIHCQTVAKLEQITE